MSLVSIRKIPLEAGELTGELRELLVPLGGMSNFVKPGERILLKPNLLGPFAPALAVTTSPELLEATARLVQEAGGICLVGDSPGCGSIESVLAATGTGAVIKKLGLEWADLETPADFEFPQAKIGRKVQLGAALKRVDKIINLPKAKTHVQMVCTGAVKNLYGLLPGPSKSLYHYRLKTREYLAEFQLDIAVCVPPVLNILDAVVAMEGEGPSGGTPRRLGFLAASSETVALDMVMSRAMNLDHAKVPLLAAAKNRNFGTTDWEKIELAGDNLDELIAYDFKQIRQLDSPLSLLPLPRKLLDFIQRHWKAVPRIEKEKCVKCMRCRDGCPVAPPAIDPDASFVANPGSCIKCYCCHEFCPVKAIRVDATFFERYILPPRLHRFATRIAGLFK